MEKLEIEGFEPIYKGVPPFIKFNEGFGYLGVLLEHKETGKIQCHLCGVLVKGLAKHLYHKHKGVTPTQYRLKVGLNLTTPLLAQSSRKLIKNNFLDLTEEKQKEVVARLRANNKKLHSKNGNYKVRGPRSSSQYENRFGTCPEQAKTLFYKEYQQFGRIPSTEEMSGKLKHIIFSRFSSYKNALISWGITEQEYRNHIIEGRINAVKAREEKHFFPKYKEDDVKKLYSDFFFENGRFPTWGEVKNNKLPSRDVFERVFGGTKSEIEESFKVKEIQYK